MILYSIYARESSSDINKAPPIESQISYIREFISNKTKDSSHELYGQEFKEYKVYSDNGFSGGDWDRPSWLQSIKDAKLHQYKILFTWKQDRLARDVEQFLWYYRIMKDYKVKVYDIDGLIDLETIGGKLKHTMISVMDANLRDVTSFKTKNAYDLKKSMAESKGQKVVWGRKSYIEYNKDIIEQIRQIKQEHPEYGYRRIHKALPAQEITRLNKNTGEFRKSNTKVSITTIIRICNTNGMKSDKTMSK